MVSDLPILICAGRAGSMPRRCRLNSCNSGFFWLFGGLFLLTLVVSGYFFSCVSLIFDSACAVDDSVDSCFVLPSSVFMRFMLVKAEVLFELVLNSL